MAPTPAKDFFRVRVTSLDSLQHNLNDINNTPGLSIIDMIASEGRIGLVYVDSSVLVAEDPPDGTAGDDPQWKN